MNNRSNLIVHGFLMILAQQFVFSQDHKNKNCIFHPKKILLGHKGQAIGPNYNETLSCGTAFVVTVLN